MSGRSGMGTPVLTVRLAIFLFAMIALIDGEPGKVTDAEMQSARDVERPATFKRARLHEVPPAFARETDGAASPPVLRPSPDVLAARGAAIVTAIETVAETARIAAKVDRSLVAMPSRARAQMIRNATERIESERIRQFPAPPSRRSPDSIRAIRETPCMRGADIAPLQSSGQTGD